MNNVKITNLPEITSPSMSGVTVINDGGTAYQVSLENIRGYKVYSALLTQQSSTVSGGTLTIGEKYVISDFNGNDDFSNVAQVLSGGSINQNYCVFIATGTTPSSWICGTTLTIIAESAPVATVLENTLGFTPQWEYITLAVYGFTQQGAFPIDKTSFYTPISFNQEYGPAFKLVDNTGFPDNFIIISDFGGPGDNTFYNTPIEIRVYN